MAASLLDNLRPTAVDRAVARALLQRDVGAGPDDPRAAAVVRFVADRVGRSPSVTRAGVRAIAAAVGLLLAARGVRVGDSPPDTVARTVAWFERVPLPGFTEYLRLIRSLVLVAWFDGAPPGS